MSSTPEGKVKEKVRKALHDLGIYTFPINQQGIGRRGIPDDFMMFNGVPCFIEFKAEMRFDKNNKAALSTWPTVLQILEMENARAAGMHTFVIDKNNADDFIDCIRRDAFYPHVWRLNLHAYDWYRNATPEYFNDVILKAITAYSRETLFKPYEVIDTIAFEHFYKY